MAQCPRIAVKPPPGQCSLRLPACSPASLLTRSPTRLLPPPHSLHWFPPFCLLAFLQLCNLRDDPTIFGWDLVSAAGRAAQHCHSTPSAARHSTLLRGVC
jgi:hypothetical protein